MFIQVWHYNGSVTVGIDETRINNVPYYRVGTLAERANSLGKVSATASGWTCLLEDEHKQKIADWLTTVPSSCFA
jgi:hypothetical protein